MAPLSPSTGTEIAEPRRETVLFAKLDLAADIIPERELEELRRILGRPLPEPPFIALPQDAQEQERLEAQYEALLSNEQPAGVRYRRLLDGLDEVFSHLDGQNVAAAKERAALLSQILADVAAEVGAYDAAARGQTERTRDGIVAVAGLVPGLAPFVETVISHDGPFAPPDTNNPELTKQMQALQLRWEELLGATAEAMNTKNAAGLRERWLAYKTQLDAYEAACETAGRAAFVETLNLPADITDDEFADFQRDLTEPLPAPPAGLPPERVEAAQRQFATLERRRAEIALEFPVNLRHGFPGGNAEAWSRQLMVFMLQRSAYERAMAGKESSMDTWMLYMGVVGSEIGEELLEEFGKINGQSALLKVPMFRDLQRGTRLKVLKGWRSIRQSLAAKGVPVRGLATVLRTMNKSPLGPGFWGKLLEVESAVTVLLWGLYMHSSDNKFKACLQFGSFIAVSKASNAVLGYAEAALTKLGIASKIPGNPAVKFGVAMAAAFIASDKITAFADWVDESIPDCTAKHAAGVGLGIASGEPIFSFLGTASEATGLSGVFDELGISGFDPERDVMAYLGEEAITVEGIVPDRRFVHRSLADWNDRLDQALASQQNPVLRQLWEGQKIDYQAWPKRRAVVLFSQVTGLAGREKFLNDTLREKGVLSGDLRLSGVAVCVADTGEARNDRQFAYFQDADPAFAAARAHIDTLPEQDPLRVQWKEYLAEGKQVAKDVAVYRHLQLYETARWLGDAPAGGDLAAMPPYVEEGLVEEIAYRTRRKRSLRPDSHPELSPQQYASSVADAVPYRDAVSLPAQLMIAFEQRIAEIKQNGIPWPSQITGYDSIDLLETDIVNLKNLLSHASQTLSRDAMSRVLLPVLQMIDAGKTASPEEIANAVRTTLNAIITAETASIPLQAVSAEQRGRLGGAHIPCYVRGTFVQYGPMVDRYGELRLDMQWDLFRFAFGGLLERSDAHLAILESADDGHSPRSLEFRCPGGDRSQWTVTSNAYVVQVRGTSIGKRRYETETFSYESWAKANLEDAFLLEPQFKRLQEEGRKRDEAWARYEAELRAAEAKEKDERTLLLDETKKRPGVWMAYPYRFVNPSRGDTPYSFICYSASADGGRGAHLFMQPPEFDITKPAWRNADRRAVEVIGDYTKLRVGILRAGETAVQPHEVRMDTLPSVDSGNPDAKFLHEAALAPVPGNPRGAVAKVLALSQFSLNQNYKNNLLDELASLCPQEEDRQRQYLMTLFREMRGKPVLYYDETLRLVNVMRAFAYGDIDTALRREAGEDHMKQIDAWVEKGYFTMQWGAVWQYHLYMKFDNAAGAWRVGLGSLDDTHHDPAHYGELSMAGGSAKYNQLVRDMASFNTRALYPAAKQAFAKAGTWVIDPVREDGLGGKIEYVCAADGRVFAQTTDGLRCWIHDFQSNAGHEQHGKYFSGVTGVLKDKPDAATHYYNATLREWMPQPYPAAKQATLKPGTWVIDPVREDGLGGKIEYVCAADGRVFAQTTDGQRCWFHDFLTNAGHEQGGKYFSGVTGTLRDKPDAASHHYDAALREWVPNS